MSEKRNPFMEKFLSRVNKLAGASPQATRPERICGNCGLPLVQNETEEACRELDKISTRLEKARAVAPVETPDEKPLRQLKCWCPNDSDTCVPCWPERQGVETRLTAEQFLSSRFEPDPNEPDEDTYWLHFPNGVECVENRAFWKKHLAELLEAFRDKSESALRDENERLHDTAIRQQEICIQWAEQWGTHDAQVAGLREEIERLKQSTFRIDENGGKHYPEEMVDVKTTPPTPAEFYSTLAHCASYPSCDGNLEGMKHSEKCPLFGRKELSLFEFAAAYTDSLYAFAENALNHGADCKVQLTELRAKLAAIIKEHETEIARYRNNFDLMIRRQDGEVWCWADDGEDHPETLACPVLIQPDVVRRFVAAEAEVAALRERERWIPVEEKLPEESKCLYSFKADILMKRGDDWRSGTFQRGQFVDVKGWVQTQITHWKALSAAPER